MYTAYFLTIIGVVFLAQFLVERDKNGSIKAVILKTCTSLMFIAVGVAGLSRKSWGSNTDLLFPSLLILIGLVMGLVGDVFLDFKIYFKGISGKYPLAAKDSEMVTYFGMVSFGISHVFYILACSLLYKIETLYLVWAGLGAVVLATIVFLVSITILKMSFGKFLIPAACYAILLCFFTIVTIFSMTSSGPLKATVFLLIGAVLFLISDLILSFTFFSKAEDYSKKGFSNPESKLFISINHILYYSAQFCIALVLGFI